MNLDKAIMRMAGVFILLSLILSQVHSLNWLWLTAFVGLNLTQASFTGFCPAVKIFKKLGIKAGTAFE